MFHIKMTQDIKPNSKGNKQNIKIEELPKNTFH